MKTFKLLKIPQGVHEITVTSHFNFRHVLCSREYLLFNNIGHTMLEDIKQLHLLSRVKKYRLETPFKGDNVNSPIKRQISKKNLYFSKKNQKISLFVLLFLVLVSKQWLENGFGFPL